MFPRASFTLAMLAAVATCGAAVPKPLDIFPEGKFVKGATIEIVPPEELDAYVDKVEAASQKNPEWFQEHMEKSPPGVPLPYDPRLGLTKEEYDEYMKLWAKREFKPVEALVMQLKKDKDGKWSISVVGGALPIATLKYDAEKDVFVSPNGVMKRLEDVKADKDTVLGAWSGHEWKFEDKNSLGQSKENFAVGKTGDGKFGMLVYRMQEISTEGTMLYDESIVIRFPLGEAGILKEEKP